MHTASPWARVGVPIGAVLVTLLIADILQPVLHGAGVFLLLLPTVMLCAVALGLAPGLLALLGGAIGAVLLVPLRGHPWLSEPLDLIRLFLYLALGGAIVVVAWVLRRLTAAGAGGHERIEIPVVLIEPLTPREAEVLGLAASGLSTTAIGAQLYLSRNTVKTHLAHAYAKLGAHNRAEAVAAGIHSGTFGPDVITIRAPEITDSVARPARKAAALASRVPRAARR